jgi:hypothetical protein
MPAGLVTEPLNLVVPVNVPVIDGPLPPIVIDVLFTAVTVPTICSCW